MHFYAWKKGLKTGMYYLRTKAATDAIKFTVDASYLNKPKTEEPSVNAVTKEEAFEQMACSLDNPEACEACGS